MAKIAAEHRALRFLGGLQHAADLQESADLVADYQRDERLAWQNHTNEIQSLLNMSAQDWISNLCPQSVKPKINISIYIHM